MKAIERKKELTKNEILSNINILFNKYPFAVVPITVINGARTYGGEKIQMGLKVLNITLMSNMTDILIHEFAHSFDYKKNGGYRKNQSNTKHVFHDKLFYNYLKEIIVFAYGDIHIYDWNNEYKGIKKLYKKEFQ